MSCESRGSQNGGVLMTNEQKVRITTLRQGGWGYKKIAQMLDLPLGTVQSFCRRENIMSAEPSIFDENHCRQCGNPLIQKSKVKKRKFCSDGCRIKWWAAHPYAKNGNTKAGRTVVCENCGKTFNVYGNVPRKYCSHGCYVAARFGGGMR